MMGARDTVSPTAEPASDEPTAASPPGGDTRPIDAQDLIRERMFGRRQSKLRAYRDLTVGKTSLVGFLWYELLTTFIGPIPGALGLALRGILYRSLFKRVGKGVVFGRSITIRHPGNIELGRGVVLDDYCLIDARGAGDDGVVVGDRVIVNRQATIQAKSGGVSIGDETNIGARSMIVSMGGVEIGAMVGIGGGCFISGGSFQADLAEASARQQAKYTRGPVRLEDRCWLGMRVSVLDGVTVGEGCIVGACSLVTRDLPPDTVAAGAPAKVRKQREQRTTAD